MSAMAGKIRAGIWVLGLVLGFYWMFTYSGLFRYFSELQIKQFGSYAPKLTILAICIVFAGAGEVVRLLLQGAERPVPQMAAQGAGVAKSATASTVKAPLSWSLPNLLAYRPLVAVVAIFGIGAYFLLLGANAGPLRELQMTDFANGSLPPHAMYAEVRGYPDRQYFSMNNYCYVPLHETPDPASPIRMFVGVDEYKMKSELTENEDGSVVARGMLEQHLTNEVRYQLEQNGFAVPNPGWVLFTTRNPGKDQTVGAVMMVASFVIGGIWFVWQKRRVPKARPLGAPVGANVGRR